MALMSPTSNVNPPTRVTGSGGLKNGGINLVISFVVLFAVLGLFYGMYKLNNSSFAEGAQNTFFSTSGGLIDTPLPSWMSTSLSNTNPNYSLENVFQYILGSESTLSWGIFIIYLAIFVMLLIVFQEMFANFSPFSGSTSWVVASGLVIIISALGFVKVIVVWMGLNAGLGVFAFISFIFTTLLAMIVINLGMGQQLQEWALQRKIARDAMKANATAADVGTAISFLRQVKGSATSGP